MGRRSVWFGTTPLGRTILSESNAAQRPTTCLQSAGSKDWAFVEVLEKVAGRNDYESLGQAVVDFNIHEPDVS
jgi:hypothetical protein